MKTQFGEVVTGDLIENTITLEIEGDMILQAGKYAIVPIEDYEKLIKVSDYSKKKLEYINGSAIARDFPLIKPTKEWVGAVLDLLGDTKLNEIV